MLRTLYTLLFLVFLAACATTQHTAKAPETFQQKLAAYCGKSFAGQTIYPEGNTDPFAGKALVIHVQSCDETGIRIPFHVGEDRSRTWVLTNMPDGLQLKHDHRHEDGTPDEVTMYGGISTLPADSLAQRFPADVFTAELLPAAATNEWTMALSPDGKTFSYILKRDGKLRYRADFDLTKPLN
ncbi:hypothetical protein GXP69_03970 [Pontibacter sp. BT327]|uniref:Lipoprotein n=2 Tax=Pontibacter burrus TaxID=2704466 RepID=A0A6B3LTQ4_9BACT|nr:hypothetical protein [Pontibacter burrus]